MSVLVTRASSINRALDEIGDRWCLLILQEAFWGGSTFGGLLAATGASRGVLSDRLKWLRGIDCLRQRHGRYRLTRKSLDLYDTALMAVAWERCHYPVAPQQDFTLRHRRCGQRFSPVLACEACELPVDGRAVAYEPGPGAARDERPVKTRRRSSLPASAVPAARNVYRQLVTLVGDRWTANVIALAFHGIARFDDFHRELPVATNTLTDRLRLLEDAGVLAAQAYQRRPRRFEYRLTSKGWDLFPFFQTLLHWGDRWCDLNGKGPPMLLRHGPCGERLRSRVRCDQCGDPLEAHDVELTFAEEREPTTAGDYAS
ncbi:winged helix-turn-helix transcriptional regulator [Pseudohaliea rubra]|uniref:Transcriptional regulator, HxlR family n=1 Tax=Pseudohaliea rubra DSM 19751 TaxID=1265313 RepID=A0A095XVD0_9GAMM|nr:winged helix-turn-helix transcriptional regulator [Pseudohaliea rubra]KGE03611.1 Transcriptional regulator, HxlR family [Pseudohaliea rubra DSM 19751]